MPSEEAKTRIRAAFERIKQTLPGFRDRKVQRWMIAEVGRTFSSADDGPGILALEAGTGTGKSLGYLLPGIVVAQEEEKTLVVSTGTVALQEQLLDKDLPLVARYGELEFRSQLAKGRGRYACIRDLERAATEDEGSDQLALDAAVWAQRPSQADGEAVAAMHRAWSAEEWDGDLDAWPEALSGQVRSLVTTNRHGCTGGACAHREHCPYYRDRDRVWGADVVVTNHNLVLADLALGGGVVLPPPEKCLYVLDEGHHLPGRAVDQFHAAAGCEAARGWVSELPRAVAETAAALGDEDSLGELADSVQQRSEALDGLLQEAHTTLAASWPGDAEQEWRFPRGEVPEDLRTLAGRVAAPARELAARFRELTNKAEKALEEARSQKDEAKQDALNKALPRLGMARERCENLEAAWSGFAETDPPDRPPLARWIEILSEQGDRSDFRVSVSPISAADQLRESLWDRCAAALITSATLTSLGRFDRLLGKIGLADEGRANCYRLPSPFDYGRALLQVPQDRLPDPRDTEAHTRAVSELLPERLEAGQGSLVLFTSRRQMEAVYERLPSEWQARTRCQGTVSRERLLADHGAEIEAGRGSVLFGLASFAEGVDLPGALCRHVVIVRLPFSVPTTPVEATTHEWVESRGGKPFFEISLPDASLRLIQAVGRLIRSEEDWGTVTILDPRVVTKPYGRDLLDSLPPIPRHFE
ncbi:ATP-dependent DNA helicase DinG [Thiohalorhabdus methylotrophus]|uniref:ATP-dependent DNA helicase DinG n=1 Tax=Thiohalorhabdus methylotrophus TaxID=3242694 RepID=A0ABV4TYG2_9GAMM